MIKEQIRMFFNYVISGEARAISDLTLLTSGFETCKPSHSFGPAIRSHYLIHFIEKGSGWFKNEKGQFPIQEGGIFLIRPSELTYYSAEETNPWVYSWVGFEGIKAKEICSAMGFTEDCPVLYTNSIPEVKHCFDRINQLVTVSKSPELGCLGFLYQIIQHFIDLNPATVSRENHKKNNRLYVDKSVHYFEENYPYRIAIGDLARFTGLDRTTLFRIFIQECGISPQEYLIRFRLKKASELLQKTALPVGEIASSVGMDNTAHFSTIFKSRIGLSPRDFRKKPVEITIRP